MSQEIAINMNLPISSIDAYITRANQTPLLTAEQEKELSERLYYQGDVAAAKELVYAHLRYVVKVARGYMGYGLSLNDLIQEGNLGLMKAVRRFNPEVGVRLVTFAMHWIKAEIHDFILKNWRIVKVATTKAQRKLFFNLRSAKKSLTWFSKQEATDIAKDLNVKPEEVFEMEKRLHAHDSSFDIHPMDSDDDNAFTPDKFLEAKNSDPYQIVAENDSETAATTALYRALAKLDERSQNILKSRWLDESKATLHELADRYQVSAERIRQLEKNAMGKLKAELGDLA